MYQEVVLQSIMQGGEMRSIPWFSDVPPPAYFSNIDVSGLYNKAINGGAKLWQEFKAAFKAEMLHDFSADDGSDPEFSYFHRQICEQFLVYTALGQFKPKFVVREFLGFLFQSFLPVEDLNVGSFLLALHVIKPCCEAGNFIVLLPAIEFQLFPPSDQIAHQDDEVGFIFFYGSWRCLFALSASRVILVSRKMFVFFST